MQFGQISKATLLQTVTQESTYLPSSSYYLEHVAFKVTTAEEERDEGGTPAPNYLRLEVILIIAIQIWLELIPWFQPNSTGTGNVKGNGDVY